ncbi:hypothetical protein LEP1GSC092_4198 [Leptospira interrogans serovar Pyrogenes str. R168]|nr:hypothetical protein LEP1GSC092_4198 [Leptospira interrogans serovar Pyrogenes str. R168]
MWFQDVITLTEGFVPLTNLSLETRVYLTYPDLKNRNRLKK